MLTSDEVYERIRAANCWCFECLDDSSLGLRNTTLSMMIVCPKCGNKRCPRATYHGNACTGSNAPNQAGSMYDDSERCIQRGED